MRRRGRPGLIGTMGRTAVIAGTANATVGAMNRGAAPHPQAQPAHAPAAPPPAAVMHGDAIAQLKQLGELHTAGVLTDQEFAQAKTKLLG